MKALRKLGLSPGLEVQPELFKRLALSEVG